MFPKTRRKFNLGFFKKQVKANTELDGLRSFVMPTGVKEVITFAGSFLGGTLFSPGKNRKTAPLTAAMIDKGTIEKDKYAISDILESVGAELTFSSTRSHVQFTGHCLKDDLDTVIQLLAEQLRTPKFSEKELTTLKTRMIGNLERSKEDTKQQAMIGLLRTIYPKNHPNYQPTTNETIEQVSTVNIKEIDNFHQKYYGLGSLNFTAVGDVKPVQINDLLGKYLNGWKIKNTRLKL